METLTFRLSCDCINSGKYTPGVRFSPSNGSGVLGKSTQAKDNDQRFTQYLVVWNKLERRFIVWKIINMVALAGIAVALAPINGPLLQRASTVSSNVVAKHPLYSTFQLLKNSLSAILVPFLVDHIRFPF
jgi:hypothetical protein